MPFFAKATPSLPYADGADDERRQLEDKHSRLIYAALRKIGQAIAPPGTTTANISAEEAVQRYRSSQGLLRDALVAMLMDGAMLGADVGKAQIESLLGIGKAAIVSGVDWDLINENVLRWVMSNGTDFGTGFGQGYADTVMDAMTQTSERQLRTLLAEWARNDLTYQQLITDLERTLFSRRRAELVATTEISRAFFQGNIISWRASGIITRYEFRNSADERVCTLCGPLGGQIVELDRPLVHPTSGAEYFGIPIHVNCRCFAVPSV